MMNIILNTQLETVWTYLRTILPNAKVPFGLNKKEAIHYYFITNTIDVPSDILNAWDQILQSEIDHNLIIDCSNLSKQITLVKGDITLLQVDAIVNAANADGLGCFSYNHKCIDNVIHTKAGPQLRMACKGILGSTNLLRSKKIPTAGVISTPGFNLPCKYILHVVGPIYDPSNEQEHSVKLARSYINCLAEAKKLGLKSIAFCCISTGVYGFPQKRAAEIATGTVKMWLDRSKSDIKVIFCTYTDTDYELYRGLF